MGLHILRHETLTLKGFGKDEAKKRYPVVLLPILVRDKRFEIEVLSVDNLPTTIHTAGLTSLTKKFRRKKIHLADPFPIDDQVSVTVIIGGDYYHSFIEGSKCIFGIRTLKTSLGCMSQGPYPLAELTANLK